MSDQPQQIHVRLASFSVIGLFGEFNHTIDLRTSERITAVIAPNGAGKTACLRLISALFKRQWTVFAKTSFAEASFAFTNGATVQILRVLPVESDDEGSSISFVFRSTEGLSQTWSPRVSEVQRGRLAGIERHLHFLTRTGPNRWTHDNTGQNFVLSELLEAFGDRLPSSVKNSFYEDEPQPFKELIDSIDCHLIETQRLLIISEEEGRFSHRTSSSLTIAKKAQALQSVISAALTQYAALSQSLDRSFPRRVINATQSGTAETLKVQLELLDEQRLQLMNAGILDTELHDQVSLPQGENVTDAVARVLTIYASDTKQKLDSLSTLLARIQLFKSLIEERFAPKTVEVERRGGFQIRNRSKAIVPLERLSSGEQHQLVLFFELLFELNENALILIDEPELSLHVAWQKKFISDLQKIIKLNQFDVVLATHSPQLIGRWEELVVDLGGDHGELD